ncbi:MAG TPA: hypothetical protein VFU32_05620, partial [Ktedonobacterales bacterium]|nr:hypothetical protein [Ktedonobacterales bacterium]
QIKRHGEALAIHELVIAMCDQAIHERPTSFAYRMKGCSLRAIGRLDEAEAANQMSHALRKAGQLL